MKKTDKILSLGWLFIAVQLPDLIFSVTLLTAIEKIKIIAGVNPLTSVEFAFVPYSHSLIATLFWAALVAVICLITPLKSDLPKRRTALVMAVAVLSHFFLDIIVHNPDLDLLGNGIYKIGLGLWNYPFVFYAFEALLLFIGLWFYLMSTKGKSFGGKYGMSVLCVILLVMNAYNVFGPAPTSTEFFAIRMLAALVFISVVVFWLDGKRS